MNVLHDLVIYSWTTYKIENKMINMGSVRFHVLQMLKTDTPVVIVFHLPKQTLDFSNGFIGPRSPLGALE